MVADKSLPMFDPDNQWVDRKFVKEFMQSFRLSPGTIGKMLCKLEDEWEVGAFEFRVHAVGDKAFVDVTDPREGTHYVHAYWSTFMSIVETVAEEPPPKTLEERVAELEERLHKLEVSFACCQH